MNASTRFLSALFATAIVCVAPAFAADANAAKARMRERVPVIDRLKVSEAVGENNRGFLEVRSGGDEAASVAAAENADRQEVFADTASKAGSSAEVVGRAFAKQIAAASAAGVWVQRENGQWYKK
ncbi:MAG TPA: DUF1318 domain-containing protein [Opitutaceae bacterium]